MSNEGSFSIEELTQNSGLARHSGETTREYINRLAEKYGFSPDQTEEFEELVTKALYGSRELSEEEREQLNDYVAQISRLSDTSKSKPVKIANTDNQQDQGKTSEPENRQAREEIEETQTTSTIEDTVRRQPISALFPVSSGRRTLSVINSRLSMPKTAGSKSINQSFNYLSHPYFTDVIYLSSLLGLSIFLFFYKLDYYAIRDWDEGVHANIARHMVQDGYWLVPHMNYNLNGFDPWMMKPPLVLWLQGLTMEILGVNEFAVRFQSAFFGVCTVGLIYIIGRSVKSRFAGFVSGAVFLTTPYLYFGFNGVRTGAMDSAHVFFGSLFVFCIWKAVLVRENQWLYYAGIAGGLTVMVKGFAAGIFVLVVFPLVVRYWRLFASYAALKGVGLTLAIVLPWALYMYFTFGYSFIQIILIQEVLLRAAGERVASKGGIFGFMSYPYFTHLWENWSFYHPWLFILIGAVSGAFPGLIEEDKRDSLFILWWIAIVLGFFAYTGTQGWYIMPIFVPGALFLGFSTSQAVKDRRALSGLLFGIILAFVYSQRFKMWNSNGYLLVLLAVCLCTAHILLSYSPFHLSSRVVNIGQTVIPVVLTILVITTYLGVPPFYQSRADYVFQQKEMGEWVNEETPTGETIYVEDGIGAMHSFSFYSERPLVAFNPGSSPQDATYAVVNTNSLKRIDKEYEIEYRLDHYNITLLEFD